LSLCGDGVIAAAAAALVETGASNPSHAYSSPTSDVAAIQIKLFFVEWKEAV
jgi:hypothetical protein